MESMPVGTQRVWTLSVRQESRQRRYIKVSHHGNWRQRWRPYSLHWWEQHVGPIPQGYQVFHRDGEALNDDPENLVLVRGERFRLIFAQHPDAARRQALRRSRAVIRSNRRRALINSFRLRPKWWYAVLPASRGIVWRPCETKEQARQISHAELKKITTDNRKEIKRNKGKPYRKGASVEYVMGATILYESCMDGRYEGYLRLIEDTRKSRTAK